MSASREKATEAASTKRDSLPDKVEISGQEFKGDVVFAAKQSVTVKDSSVEGSAKSFTGLGTQQEVDDFEKLTDEMSAVIRKNVLPFCGSSTRILLRIGACTICQAYTPDSDGVVRDESGVAIAGLQNANKEKEDKKPFSAMTFLNFSSSHERVVENYKNVIAEPQGQIKILSVSKLR